MRLDRALIFVGLLLAFLAPSSAWAQCSGQFPANTVCANPGASVGLPQVSNRISLAPPQGTTKALTIEQIGPDTGTIGSTSFAYNSIFVNNDQLTATSPQAVTSGLSVTLQSYGADGGTKSAISSTLNHPVASNQSVVGDYIATNNTITSDASFGGTNTGAGAKGTIFASSFFTQARTLSSNMFEVAGAEIDVGIYDSASSHYRLGWSMVSIGTQRGAAFDAAYEIGSATNLGWGNGVLLAFFHGFQPISVTGCAYCTDGAAATIGTGFDLSPYTVTGYFLRGPGTNSYIDGNANAGFASVLLGTNRATSGVLLANGTSTGVATFNTQVAQGTPNITIPTGSGTIVTSVTAPVVIDSVTGRISCATCVTSSGGGAITGTPPIAVSSAGVVSITGAAGQVLAGASPAFTATPVLGVAGSTVGSLGFENATTGRITLQAVAGALGTVTLLVPAAADTLVARATTDTLTNKSISGSTNTLSNIGNASLTNSSTTVNGQTCTLGSTCTVTATATATLTFGTHLTSGGSSYNGSAGVTITSDATSANTASTIVARDGSGNFVANIITASLTGHASLDCALTGCTMSGAIAMGANNITGAANVAASTFNGNTFTTGTGVLTIAASKTLTASNTLTFTGTDGSSVAFGTGGTVLYGNQTITLSGDVGGSGTTAITTVLGNIPTGVTMAGSILATNIAAPGSPAAGKVSIWTDSTDLRFHDKNASGVIGTTVVADTGAASNYISAISAAGVVTKSRPSCATLSDSGAGCTAVTMTATAGGLVPTPPNNTTTFLRGDGTFASVVGADVALTSAHVFVGNAGNVAADVAMSGDVSIANTGATTLVTAQPAVHTWALAQTFTVAPVFTDQSGSRAALGLGTMATQNASAVAITGGTIAGLTGFAIRDTSAAFDVTIAATSGTALTAGRTLTLNMGNVAHTLAFGTTANTITFPNAASDTVAMLGVGNTFSAVQTISVNGANQLVVKALASNNSYIQLDTSATTVQAGLAFNENGAAKWSFIKQTDNSFLIFDNVNGIVAQSITPGATTVGSVSFGYTTDATSASTGAIRNPGGMSINKRVFMNGITTSSGLQTAVLCQSSAGEVIADSVACLASSKDFKEGFKKLTDITALNNVVRFSPQSWRYRREGNVFPERYYRERIGLVAEDVAEVDKRLVEYDNEGHVRTIDYNGVVTLTVGAISALEARLEKLENRK